MHAMQPNGVVLVLCKQIDNYGDVGFCIRLCRALQQSHHIILLHHCQEALIQLGFGETPTTAHPHRIEAIDCTHGIPPSVLNNHIQAIVEPFGTSSLHAPPFFDAELKKKRPNTPWLVIDYLSAEPWVENLHANTMIEPSTGHKATLYSPGFSHKTAGIIHHDAMDWHHEFNLSHKPFATTAYIFAYANTPIHELTKALKQWGCTSHMANSSLNNPISESKATVDATDLNLKNSIANEVFGCVVQPWVHQIEFDALLHNFDLLFVRGEDSFVRAQLAGKPFVWNIYPTADHAHLEKLNAFFQIYANGLSTNAANAVWILWCFWNRMPNMGSIRAEQCIANLVPHWHEWNEHALHWRSHLRDLPDLGEAVLKWIDQH